MPYQPERAWCDDCGSDVPVSHVEFNKLGLIKNPILCTECEASRAFDRIRDRSRNAIDRARKGHPTHD